MDNDQAKKLRDLVKQANECPTIIFLSHKDGVGKTTVATNVASMACNMGKNTLLVDCGLGLLTTDVLLNTIPKHSASRLLSEEKSIEDTLVTINDKLNILYGKSLIKELRKEEKNLNMIQNKLQSAKDRFDLIIIDISVYDANCILKVIDENIKVVFVLTPKDSKCLRETYEIMKYLSKDKKVDDMKIIINKVEDIDSANEAYDKLSMAAKKFLSIDISKLGYISKSELIPESIKKRTPIVSLYEDSEIYKEFEHIVSEMEKDQ